MLVGGVVPLLTTLGGLSPRATAVAQGRRNPFVLLGRAAGFCVRHPGALALGLLGLLLHAALLLLVRTALGAIGGTVAAIVPQQLAVLAWLWIKLLRLAWALSYVRLHSGSLDTRAGEAALNLAAGY